MRLSEKDLVQLGKFPKDGDDGGKGSIPNIVEATFGTGLRSGDGLTFHLFGERHPLDLTRHYYEVTGFPRLPARWALGPWVWRHVEDQGQVLD